MAEQHPTPDSGQRPPGGHGNEIYHMKVISFPQDDATINRSLQRGMSFAMLVKQHPNIMIHMVSAEQKPQRDFIEVRPGETLTKVVVHDATATDLHGRKAVLAQLIIIAPAGRIVAVIPADMSKVYEAAIAPQQPKEPIKKKEEGAEAIGLIRSHLKEMERLYKDHITPAFTQLDKLLWEQKANAPLLDEYVWLLDGTSSKDLPGRMGVKDILLQIETQMSAAAQSITSIPPERKTEFMDAFDRWRKRIVETRRDITTYEKKRADAVEESEKKGKFKPGDRRYLSGRVVYNNEPQPAKITLYYDTKDQRTPFFTIDAPTGTFTDKPIYSEKPTIILSAQGVQNPSLTGKLVIDLSKMSTEELDHLDITLKPGIYFGIDGKREQTYIPDPAKKIDLRFILEVSPGFDLQGKDLVLEPIIRSGRTVQGQPGEIIPWTALQFYRFEFHMGTLHRMFPRTEEFLDTRPNLGMHAPFYVSELQGKEVVTATIPSLPPDIPRRIQDTPHSQFSFGFQLKLGDKIIAEEVYTLVPQTQLPSLTGELPKDVKEIEQLAEEFLKGEAVADSEIERQKKQVDELYAFVKVQMESKLEGLRSLRQRQPYVAAGVLKDLHDTTKRFVQDHPLGAYAEMQQKNTRRKEALLAHAGKLFLKYHGLVEQVQRFGQVGGGFTEERWQQHPSIVTEDALNGQFREVKDILEKITYRDLDTIGRKIEQIGGEITNANVEAEIQKLAELANELHKTAERIKLAQYYLNTLKGLVTKLLYAVKQLAVDIEIYRRELRDRGITLPGH